MESVLGKCKSCGAQVGVLHLKNGICKKCQAAAKPATQAAAEYDYTLTRLAIFLQLTWFQIITHITIYVALFLNIGFISSRNAHITELFYLNRGLFTLILQGITDQRIHAPETYFTIGAILYFIYASRKNTCKI